MRFNMLPQRRTQFLPKSPPADPGANRVRHCGTKWGTQRPLVRRRVESLRSRVTHDVHARPDLDARAWPTLGLRVRLSQDNIDVIPTRS